MEPNHATPNDHVGTRSLRNSHGLRRWHGPDTRAAGRTGARTARESAGRRRCLAAARPSHDEVRGLHTGYSHPERQQSHLA